MYVEWRECVVKRGVFFFFKQKTAYEIKECDWSSDVCSSDLNGEIAYKYIYKSPKGSGSAYVVGGKSYSNHLNTDRKSVV